MASSVHRLERISDVEIMRQAVYKAVPRDFSELKPVEIMSYNLVMGTHLHIRQYTETTKTTDWFPSHFSHVNNRGKRVLLDCVNSVAHLNHYKGERLAHPSDYEVRTFVEQLRARAPTSYQHVGIRMWHLLVRSSGNGAARVTKDAQRLVVESSEEKDDDDDDDENDKDKDADGKDHELAARIKETRETINELILGGAAVTRDSSINPALMTPGHAVVVPARDTAGGEPSEKEQTKTKKAKNASRSSSSSSSSDSGSESGSDSSSSGKSSSSSSSDSKRESKNKNTATANADAMDIEHPVASDTAPGDKRADDSDDEEDSDGKDDMEVNEDDSDAIEKADSRFFTGADAGESAGAKQKKPSKAATKKAVKAAEKIASAEASGTALTFRAGFQAHLNEAHRYKEFIAPGDGKGAKDLKEYNKVVQNISNLDLTRITPIAKSIEDMLSADSVFDEHINVFLSYLNDEPAAVRAPAFTADAIARGDGVFLDSRGCADPNPHDAFAAAVNSSGKMKGQQSYAQFDNQLNPEVVLSPITAFNYFTANIEPNQRDPSAYFEIDPANVSSILNRARELDGGLPGPDAGEDGEDPVVRNYMRAQVSSDALTRALRDHPHRIELAKLAKITPDAFRGFPYPGTVYELSAPLVQPSAILMLPLPHTLCTHVPFAYLDGETAEEAGEKLNVEELGLFEPHFQEHVLALTTAACINKMKIVFPYVNLKREHARPVLMNSMLEEVKAARGAVDRLSRDETAFPRSIKTRMQVLDAATRLCTDGGLKNLQLFTHLDIFACTTLDSSFHQLLRQSDQKRVSFLNLLREKTVTDTAGVHAAEGCVVIDQENPDKAAPQLHIDPTMTRVYNQVRESKNNAQDASDRARTAPGAAARRDNASDERAMYLSSIPAEIVARDAALQLNISNTSKYQRLNTEYMHDDADMGEYAQRYRDLMLDAVREADQTLMTSDKIDEPLMKARNWYKTIEPAKKNMMFATLPTSNTYTSFRVFIQETLVSPVASLSQNPGPMTIAYFTPKNASHYYEIPTDPHLGLIFAGDGMAGKSFLLTLSETLSAPGVCISADHMSTHAMHVQKNLDGYCYLFHEFQHRYLFPAQGGKDGGSSNESGDALTFFKARLTKGRSSIIVLRYNKETGERDIDMFETSNQSTNIAATNDNLKGADENVLSRFIVISIPKSRDQAEGSSPVEKISTDEVENRKLVEEHYKERTILNHRLLHFANMRSDFYCKCGVFNFMTNGGRFTIDVVLNEVMRLTGNDTRDPRKRKLTEELARTMASMYMNWMALGSPMAAKFASHPGNPDLWSPEAFVLLGLPFAFIPKAVAFDALTLLEGIWSPEYFNHILFSMVFDVAHLQNLEYAAFARKFRNTTSGEDHQEGVTGVGASHYAPIGGGGGGASASTAGNTMYEAVPDFNYIMIEADTDSGIYNKVSDTLSKMGIRTADVDYYSSKCTKQYITTHAIVREEPKFFSKEQQQQQAAVQKSAGPVSQFDELFKHKGPAEAANMTTVLQEAMKNPVTGTAVKTSTAAEIAQRIEAGLVADGLPPMQRGTEAPVKQAYGSDGLRLVYDKSRDPVRIPIMKRGFKDPNRPQAGRVLMISTEYAMQQLGFSVMKPHTMREVIARSKATVHKAHASEPIAAPRTKRELLKEARAVAVTPPVSFEWGARATADFVRRVNDARALSDAGSDTANIMVRAIKNVFQNKYLERAPVSDIEETLRVEAICAEYDSEFATDPNPAKRHLYPFNDYITSYSCGDMYMHSKRPLEYPNGRHITHQSELKRLVMRTDPANARPVQRLNHSRLSRAGDLVLNNMPFGHQYADEDFDVESDADAMDIDEDAKRLPRIVVNAAERMNVARYSQGVYYTADVDYFESKERMLSVCHPGYPLAPRTKVPAFGPVLYGIMRTVVKSMVTNRELDLRSRSDVEAAIGEKGLQCVLYPEDDPRLMLEYPTLEIVRRTREIEIRDANESDGNYNHLTSAEEVFNHNNQVGQLTFSRRVPKLAPAEAQNPPRSPQVAKSFVLPPLCDAGLLTRTFSDITRNFRKSSRNILATRPAQKKLPSSGPTDNKTPKRPREDRDEADLATKKARTESTDAYAAAAVPTYASLVAPQLQLTEQEAYLDSLFG